ncbi:PREDICTED: carbonic anhydrase-related protein-like [Priapulus caudatus]|uniref:Carbonic anhydrase n=1 Tax=Priapulus caudatus TaxID=37621 RepID=A0ABM1EJ24_PRICU|nr:PREDICTED: carbonic anhydrase-related protein-like [Priapulus caudatus]
MGDETKKPTSGDDEDWNYTGPNASIMWPLHYPDAGGEKQSPINLVSMDAIHDASLEQTPLQFHYEADGDWELCNGGNLLNVTYKAASGDSYFSGGVPNSDYKPALSGGPLPNGHEFTLADLRMHWGKDGSKGSEHTVNGKAFPMEVHLVHWNSTLYRSLGAAIGKENGIAIIVIFVQVGREHSGLKRITDNLHEVQYKDRKYNISEFDPSWLLPDPMLRDYWVYEGSLTTPPCSENTTWVIFRYPLTSSHSQMEEFRRLLTYPKGGSPSTGVDANLVDNFRPAHPLNNRVIRASFPV